MNKNIKLAVAGAVLALSASAANAGIIIPAGDWTLDINGNVNAFATWHKADHANTIRGGLASGKDVAGEDQGQNINTGLLPSQRCLASGLPGLPDETVQHVHGSAARDCC